MLLASLENMFPCVLYATQGCVLMKKRNMGSLAEQHPPAMNQSCSVHRYVAVEM